MTADSIAEWVSPLIPSFFHFSFLFKIELMDSSEQLARSTWTYIRTKDEFRDAEPKCVNRNLSASIPETTLRKVKDGMTRPLRGGRGDRQSSICWEQMDRSDELRLFVGR